MATIPPAADAARSHTRTDLDLLQGAWRAVAGRRGARLLVDGTRFTFEFTDGDLYIGIIRLNSDAAPKHMDMKVKEGPAAHRGRVALCIYDVDGEVLRWCPTAPGAGYRLTRFPSVDDDRYFSLVFRRDGQTPAS
jgi:uncharacterized protein (TIGR03067 family)